MEGQSAFKPYSILGPPATAATLARTEKLRAILAEGWNVTPAEAAQLETQLLRDPENLSLRMRLLSYYTQFLLNEPRVRHILWLIENHPDADTFQDPGPLTRLPKESVEYQRAKALWQQQARRFPKNTKVLSNAATALAGDPEVALPLVKTLRSADPANMEWTKWLAKTYADAIRWSYWDGKSAMTFTGDQEDYRHLPIELPPSMRKTAKTEVESSTDATLVRATGEALMREVRLLLEKSNSAPEGSTLITPELPPVADFGEALVRRARALELQPPRQPAH